MPYACICSTVELFLVTYNRLEKIDRLFKCNQEKVYKENANKSIREEKEGSKMQISETGIPLANGDMEKAKLASNCTSLWLLSFK